MKRNTVIYTFSDEIQRLGEVMEIPLPNTESINGTLKNRREIYFKPNKGTTIQLPFSNDYTDSVDGESTPSMLYPELTTQLDSSQPETVLGSYYIGESYIHEEGDGKIDYENTRTYTISASGENNEIDITIMGEKPKQWDFHYFSEKLDSGSTNIHVWLKYDNDEHYITNIVAFDSTYEPNGSNIPEKFSYIRPDSEIVWHESKTLGDDNLLNYTFSKVSDNEHMMFYSTDDPVKSMLIYVDRYFAAFKSNWRSEEYNGELNYSCYASKDKFNHIDSTEIPTAYLEVNGTLLYAGKKHFEMEEGSSDDPLYQYNIQNEDRWVRLLKMESSSSESISKLWNVVRTVDFENPIDDIPSAHSEQMRFTGYWVKSGREGDDILSATVAKPTETISHPMSNQLFYPIFKPWAEVDLSVINPEFPKELINTCLNAIKKNYGEQYIKHFYIDVSKPSSKNDVILKNYSLAISPNRNEFWYSHGYRRLFDSAWDSAYSEEEKKQKFFARTGVQYSSDKWLFHDDIKKLHNVYNSRSPVNRDGSLGFYMYCCFAGGLVVKSHRNRSPFTYPSFQSAAEQFLNVEDNPNSWWFFATSPSNIALYMPEGTKYRSMVQPQRILEKYIKPMSSDSSSDSGFMHVNHAVNCFNRLVKNCKKYTFILIRRFFQENGEMIRSCLVGDRERHIWDEVKQATIDDIAQKGARYFATRMEKIPADNASEAKKWNYNAEDYFFDGKAHGDGYRIHDGFIGMIVEFIFNDNINGRDYLVKVTRPKAYYDNEEKYKSLERSGIFKFSLWVGEPGNQREIKPTDIDFITYYNIWTRRSDITSKLRQLKVDILNIWEKGILGLTLQQLKQQDKAITIDNVRQGDYDILTYECSIKTPVMGYHLKDENTRLFFFDDPNSDTKRWLTSDDDLERIVGNSI